MASDEVKDKVGSILFSLVSAAVAEIPRGSMKFTMWADVDDETRQNYMGVVEQIAEAFEGTSYICEDCLFEAKSEFGLQAHQRKHVKEAVTNTA